MLCCVVTVGLYVCDCACGTTVVCEQTWGVCEETVVLCWGRGVLLQVCCVFTASVECVVPCATRHCFLLFGGCFATSNADLQNTHGLLVL